MRTVDTPIKKTKKLRPILRTNKAEFENALTKGQHDHVITNLIIKYNKVYEAHGFIVKNDRVVHCFWDNKGTCYAKPRTKKTSLKTFAQMIFGISINPHMPEGDLILKP